MDHVRLEQQHDATGRADEFAYAALTGAAGEHGFTLVLLVVALFTFEGWAARRRPFVRFLAASDRLAVLRLHHKSMTTSSCGREQQISTLPAAGGSSGSGL